MSLENDVKTAVESDVKKVEVAAEGFWTKNKVAVVSFVVGLVVGLVLHLL